MLFCQASPSFPHDSALDGSNVWSGNVWRVTRSFRRFVGCKEDDIDMGVCCCCCCCCGALALEGGGNGGATGGGADKYGGGMLEGG